MNAIASELKTIAKSFPGNEASVIMQGALEIEGLEFKAVKLQSLHDKTLAEQKRFMELAGYDDDMDYAAALNDLLKKTKQLAITNDWLNTSQVTERYGKSRKTIYTWVKKGLLPAPSRIPGRNPRWKRSDLDKFDSKAAGMSNRPPIKCD